MLPWDIPGGPWQEITTNYFTHKGKDYLLVCDSFSKYPFLYKVTSLSLSQKLKELITQYGPPNRTYTDNSPHFVSKDFKQFL